MAGPHALLEGLTSSQMTVAHAVRDGGGNMFMTGEPGTGKTFVLGRVKGVLDAMSMRHRTIAPTGAAAHLAGGSTIHAAVGPLPNGKYIYADQGELHTCLVLLRAGKLGMGGPKEVIQARDAAWKNLDFLIIDEVSLIEAGLFQIVDYTARIIRGCDKPFGGLRVLATGDPYQLGPSDKAAVHFFRRLRIMPDDDEFSGDFFEEWPWRDGNFLPYVLRENMRQRNDKFFRDILERIRAGECVEDWPRDVRNALHARCVNDPLHTVPGAYVLFWARVDARRRNESESAKIAGPVLIELMCRSGVTIDDADAPKERRDELDRRRGELFERTPTSTETVTIKHGTRVQLLKNGDVAAGIYRGALGTALELVKNAQGEPCGIRVQLDGGGKVVIDRVFETVDLPGVGQAYVDFWPLDYGWSGTYHSAQGKTIPKVVCAVGRRLPPGMLYVGLSRAPTLESVTIIPNVSSSGGYGNAETDVTKLLDNPQVVAVDWQVKKFMASVEKAAKHADMDPMLYDEMIEDKRTPARVEYRLQTSCELCWSNRIGTAFMPCGHAAFCGSCAAESRARGVVTCFVCGGNVTDIVSISLVDTPKAL